MDRKKLTLNHLKRFGSEVYTHIPKQFRSKFESKAKKMILVGYDGNSKNDRIMDPETLKITVTRDIVVNEKDNAQDYTRKAELATFSFQDSNNREIEENEKDNIQIEIDREEELPADISKDEEKRTHAVEEKRELRDRKILKNPLVTMNTSI